MQINIFSGLGNFHGSAQQRSLLDGFFQKDSRHIFVENTLVFIDSVNGGWPPCPPTPKLCVSVYISLTLTPSYGFIGRNHLFSVFEKTQPMLLWLGNVGKWNKKSLAYKQETTKKLLKHACHLLAVQQNWLCLVSKCTVSRLLSALTKK